MWKTHANTIIIQTHTHTDWHIHKPHVIIAIGTQQNDDKTYSYEVIMIFKIYNKDFGAKFAYEYILHTSKSSIFLEKKGVLESWVYKYTNII